MLHVLRAMRAFADTKDLVRREGICGGEPGREEGSEYLVRGSEFDVQGLRFNVERSAFSVHGYSTT